MYLPPSGTVAAHRSGQDSYSACCIVLCGGLAASGCGARTAQQQCQQEAGQEGRGISLLSSLAPTAAEWSDTGCSPPTQAPSRLDRISWQAGYGPQAGFFRPPLL